MSEPRPTWAEVADLIDEAYDAGYWDAVHEHEINAQLFASDALRDFREALDREAKRVRSHA